MAVKVKVRFYTILKEITRKREEELVFKESNYNK